MAISRLLFVLLISLTIGTINAQGPPKFTSSYKATGEMVETLEDETKLLMQIAFEESYDTDTQNSALNLWIMGKNVTFVENYKTNQTFRYTDGNACEQMTVEEWITSKNIPSLLKYEDTNGTVRFSLKQLLSLPDKLLSRQKNVSSVFRGIPARKWVYEMYGNEPDSTRQRRVLNVYAYWSDGSWNTTSSQESVPLGYIISKMEYKRGTSGVKLHEQFIQVFAFVPNAINHKLFEPIQGVVCEKKVQTRKFPDVSKIRAISLHSEVIFPEYTEIKYVDTWFDPLNKMMRMDNERIKDALPHTGSKTHKYQKEMVLGKMGIVFRLAHYKNMVSCSVIPIKDYDLDIQNIINFKAKLTDWSVEKIFGLNQTSYTYIGMTTKRDIPCHLFQGKRTDWPEPAAKVESLWEWCFSLNDTTKADAVIFSNGEYGLINAQVTILKSGSNSDYPEKFRIFHHFYDVNKINPSLTDASNFDIGRCFQENEKRRLQFAVDWQITDDSIDLIENATSDVNFIKIWKTSIYKHSNLDPNLMRISDVRSIVTNKQLIVKFTILNPHNDLPSNIKDKEISSFKAENNLRDRINNREIFENYIPSAGAQPVRMGVVEHSLKFQINTTFQPHIPPTTTPGPGTTMTRFPFSLVTEPDRDESSPVSPVTGTGTGPESTATGGITSSGNTPSLPTGKPTTSPLNEHKTLHKGGDVAMVSIAMLLVGITIGSSGVFIKMNGLPTCLKCSGSSSV